MDDSSKTSNRPERESLGYKPGDRIKKYPACECRANPEQPNQNLMIITEIEGLMSQVNDKVGEIPIGSYIGSVKRRDLVRQAIEEIDLFQKTTLYELRKAFE